MSAGPPPGGSRALPPGGGGAASADGEPGGGSPSAAGRPVLTRIGILPEWADANGHMNVAYYVLAFDRATDALYDALGLGWSILADGRSVFTLAMNVDYLNEVLPGETVEVASRLLDFDAKRLHYFHEMVRVRDGAIAATNEVVALHIGMADRRSAPFPAAVLERLATTKAAHAALPPPPRAGRRLGLARD